MNRLRWVERLLNWLTVLSGTALAAMVLLVVADVLRANLLRRPIIGAIDLVQALLALIVFLGLPRVIFEEGNITVDVIDHFVGKRAVDVLRASGGLFAFAYLVLLLWHMVTPALDTLRFGDISPDLKIPIFLIWIPVLLGMAASAVAALVVSYRRLRGSDGAGKAG
jgi:TRAP-type C4-dicarboxylate transport system permease small subunit